MSKLLPPGLSDGPSGLVPGAPVIDWSRLGAETEELLREHTYARATQRTYRSAWGVWLRWTAGTPRKNGEARPALPASPYDVADHLAWLATLTPTSVSRIETAAAAIACAMALAGFAYERHHEVLKKTLRAARRKIGVAPRNQKQPLVAELLERVCAPLGDERLIDVRDRCILVTGFLSGARRSNLAALDFPDDVIFTRHGCELVLRRGKADQEGRGHQPVIPTQPDPKLDAACTIREWVHAAGIEEHSPLFVSVDRWENLGPRLGPAEIYRIVQRRIDDAGIAGVSADDFGAHSLRSGFCTSAAEAGATIDTIMATTGHRKADTVLTYIRRANRYRDNAARDLLGRRREPV